MRRLRTASSRHILALCAAIAVLAGGAAVAQAALSGASAPPAKPLDQAIYDASRAPDVAGLSARIHFTNNLLPSGSLPGGGSSPLASGADGRLWIQMSGKFRLELQSDSGDAQIVSDGSKVTVYDASSNTVYRVTLPSGATDAAKPADHADRKLTLDEINKTLDELAKTWTISGAQPTSTAGQPTYTVKISPKDDGGLLGAAEVAWDAVHGAPLRAAVYAQGQSQPVLQIEATDVSYDAVPDSAVDITPPAGATVNDFSPKKDLGGKAHAGSHAKQADVQGLENVQRAAGFEFSAPATLAGLPRKEVRLVNLGEEKGALAIYGQGFGAIGVLAHKATPAKSGAADKGGRHALRLPEINIGGATGSELATALGTVVTFERGGVSYVVAGSVPPVAAENAARGLQ
jgi:outer membrane lipoprotein-sorting protein